MLEIIFSIPIHHRFEVVVDQILNYRNFNPNCGFVFHISQGFDYKESKLSKEQFESIASRLGGIYINPTSVRTGRADIIQAHLSNYKYAKGKTDFEYFIMCSSNESFIKPGLYDHIKYFDCGVESLDVTYWTDNNHYANDMKTDPFTIELLKGCNFDRCVFSHIEGQYYKKELFDTICTIIEKYYDYRLAIKFYPREEYYFSTVFASLKHKNPEYKVGPIFAYSAYHFGHLFDARPSEISKLINNSPDIFTVKRVDRTINDNVRCYLRQKNGYLKQEIELLSNYVNIVTMSRLRISIVDLKKIISTIWQKRQVVLRRLGFSK